MMKTIEFNSLQADLSKLQTENNVHKQLQAKTVELYDIFKQHLSKI